MARARADKVRRYSVPALEKGLDILEALASADLPLSLTELSRVLERTPSELFRMLNVLEARSYVRRDSSSDCYELTLKLYELAHTHSPVDHLLRAAAQPTRALTQSIRESCHISVLSDFKLVVVHQTESPELVRLSVEVGYRALPLRTASGRLLVAFLSDAERNAFFDQDEVYKSYKKSERATLHAEIEATRKSGFVIAESTRRTGIDVACIVGNHRIGVIAALCVPFLPGTSNQGREKHLVPQILDCGRAIAESMGVTPFTTGLS